MLGPYRVLDLTDNRASLAAMILADFGADVVKVEPTGSRDRSAGRIDPQFAAYNRNKRSVTLDLAGAGDRDQFLSLVRGSGFLFENYGLGAMRAIGLDRDVLRRANPSLVHVSITPFGQDGPLANHHATDLTLAAMGGMMAVTGDHDRPPLRISVPQTWRHAGAEAAVAALIAHHRRLQTGRGQFVDLSVQGVVVWTLLNGMIAHAIQGKDFERNGTLVALGPLSLKVMYECSDGYTILSPNLIMHVLIPWMIEADVVPDSWLTDEDWTTYYQRLMENQPVSHPMAEVEERIEAFTRLHSKQEMLERGMPLGIFFAPVNSIPDLLEFDHLQSRRYWQVLEPVPIATSAPRAPGPFVRFSSTPIRLRRGVPRIGEHNEEVLGLAQATRQTFAAAGGHLPFSGLKVADFSWVVVGPYTAKYFADHGATTVHVESSVRPDILRVVGPFKDGQFGVNRSQYFGAFNTSKYSLSIDLRNPAGQDVAHRLMRWADVCLESFTPGTMARFGLDYASVRSENPRLIMASTCLMGQSGPAAGLGGYGFHAAAISGFPYLTGWPDRPPSGPWAAYTDAIAPRFLAASIMAALDHRRRTGEGQYIEQSQMESALHFLAPEILDCQISGRVPVRRGNDSNHAAPHGAYPCSGDDEWCAIAVENDEQWQALRRVMGDPLWAAAKELDSMPDRIACRLAIDEHLSEWTRQQERYDLMTRLQQSGIPADVVQRSSDLLRDPQLLGRGFFRPLPHPEMGDVPYEGHQFRIEGYDSGARSAAPMLGEHNLEVLTQILKMTEDDIGELAASGALV